MAKKFDFAAAAETTMAAEAEATKKRFETEPGLVDFREVVRNNAATAPARAEESREPQMPEVPAAVVPVLEERIARKRTTARVSKRVAAEPSGAKSRMSYLPTDDDNNAINQLVGRAFSMNRRLTMSQIIRVAVRALVNLTDDQLLDAIDSTPEMVRGRPRQ